MTPAVLRDWPLPAPGTDKNSRGQLLVVGGARSTAGALVLAAEAGLRAGAGKLRLATVETVAAPTAVAVPEAQVSGLPQTPSGDLAASAAEGILGLAEGCDAVLLGPGFTNPAAAADLLEAVIGRLETGVVIDAVASAFVTEHPDGLRRLDGRCVLTVNPTELSRCVHADEVEVTREPLWHTAALARRSGVVVLCGGTRKIVAAPDGRRWVVEGGGTGLAVSGSGDVQAGIVAGLVARGAEPAQAAAWGGYLHARAGERLAASVGKLGFLARELPAEVPRVLAELAG